MLIFVRRIGFLLLICGLFASGVSAQNTDASITDIQDISLLMSDNFDHRWSSISPDGSHIVWATWISNTLLCQFEIETEIERCLNYREEGFNSYVRAYTWSPDGRYIAFTETLNDRGYEPDIWVYDVHEHEIINLTDDDIGQIYEEEAERMQWDVVPTWNPASGDLYFIRIEVEQSTEESPSRTYINHTLFYLDLEDESLHKVRDLSDYLLPGGTFQHPPIRDFQGGAAISMNGRYMVVHNHRTASVADVDEGFWIIDLEGEIEPYLLAIDSDVFSSGSPSDFDEFLYSYSINWVADDSAILLSITHRNGEYHSNLIYLPIEENATPIPLFDLSNLDTDSILTEDSPDGYSWRFTLPRYAIVLPDSFTVLTYHHFFRDTALATITLPPDPNSGIEVVYSIEDTSQRAMTEGRSNMSNNGSVYMGGIIIKLEQ